MENEIRNAIIEATCMKEFSITLDTNPSTGYSWVPLFDAKFLELRDRSFKPNNKESKRLGSSSKEVFTFTPIQRGNTTITLTYKREWEENGIQTTNFEIKIKKKKAKFSYSICKRKR